MAPTTQMDQTTLMIESDLATLVRRKRKESGLTQTELANRLVRAGRANSLSKQAISQAENPKPGDGMTALRIALVEELTDRQLVGPFWVFEDAIDSK